MDVLNSILTLAEHLLAISGNPGPVIPDGTTIE
jgi:hypothetical protein